MALAPFVLFRIGINVFSYFSGVNILFDDQVPWLMYYVCLIFVLVSSFFSLTRKLLSNYPDEYKEMKRSLYIFFFLEISLYLCFSILDSISGLHLID